jgi:hypothetical protein
MTQKRDDGRAVWLDCERQGGCAIARKRRGEHLQRARSQERSRVHTCERKRLRAPAVGRERRATLIALGFDRAAELLEAYVSARASLQTAP